MSYFAILLRATNVSETYSLHTDQNDVIIKGTDVLENVAQFNKSKEMKAVLIK